MCSSATKMPERPAAIPGALMTASDDCVSRSSMARSCISNVHPCQVKFKAEGNALGIAVVVWLFAAHKLFVVKTRSATRSFLLLSLSDVCCITIVAATYHCLSFLPVSSNAEKIYDEDLHQI